MKCVRCKKQIDDNDLFCGYCGVNQVKFIKYINKVCDKIHKDRDKDYTNRVNQAQKNLKELQQEKTSEINRITTNRWKSCGTNNFLYNVTEGKININGSIYLFSDIKGAEMVTNFGYRTITNTTGTSNEKSKKHASIGGAVAGGLILGPLGAVVGGSSLGKTTTKGKNKQITTSNDIPTCHHIGVKVNIRGFDTEIVVLSQTVDQNCSKYNHSINIAQKIIDTLRNLSETPVPKKFLKPEEEQSVLDLESKIKIADETLKKELANKPNYEIPESYFE